MLYKIQVNTRYLLTLALTPLVLYLAGTAPQDAHAALSIVVQDQASCEAAPLNGTWFGPPDFRPSCHITDLKLNRGDSFTLDDSIYPFISMDINGTVNSAGTITLNDLTTTHQTINNNGTLNIYSQFSNEGTINNNSGGTINVTIDLVSEGTINNAYGATLNNYANILSTGCGCGTPAVINNYGTLNNTGTFDNYDTINNQQTGTIYNYNQMNNYDTVNNHGTVNNPGAFSNSGIFHELCSSTFNGNPVTGNPIQNVCKTTS